MLLLFDQAYLFLYSGFDAMIAKQFASCGKKTTKTCHNSIHFTKQSALISLELSHPRPGGYKTFFMLNSAERKISSAHRK